MKHQSAEGSEQVQGRHPHSPSSRLQPRRRHIPASPWSTEQEQEERGHQPHSPESCLQAASTAAPTRGGGGNSSSWRSQALEAEGVEGGTRESSRGGTPLFVCSPRLDAVLW